VNSEIREATMGGVRQRYVHGRSNAPSLGDTIDVAFHRTVRDHGDRHALIVRRQGLRRTDRRLQKSVGATAA
jgi:hypothetical protein